MSVPSKAALWHQVSRLLTEHERAQSEAIRRAVVESWETLRGKLQVLAIEDAEASAEGDAG